MRVWAILCFVGCISALYARNTKTLEVPDDNPHVSPTPHIERVHLEKVTPREETDNTKDTMKADLPSPVREISDVQKISEEEPNNQETFFIVTKDLPSPPGGGVRLIDPKIETLLPPLQDSPWWERWWNAVISWFSNESSGGEK